MKLGNPRQKECQGGKIAFWNQNTFAKLLQLYGQVIHCAGINTGLYSYNFWQILFFPALSVGAPGRTDLVLSCSWQDWIYSAAFLMKLAGNYSSFGDQWNFTAFPGTASSCWFWVFCKWKLSAVCFLQSSAVVDVQNIIGKNKVESIKCCQMWMGKQNMNLALV